MPLFLQTDTGPKLWRWVNPDMPAGNTINSGLLLNTKTPFASTISIPVQYATIGGIAHISGRGVYGMGLLAVGMTVSIEMAGLQVASVAVTPVASLTNVPWGIDVTATILNNGTVEVQGMGNFNNSLVPVKNTVPYTMDVSVDVPVTISVSWGALSVGGSISMRQMVVEVT